MQADIEALTVLMEQNLSVQAEAKRKLRETQQAADFLFKAAAQTLGVRVEDVNYDPSLRAWIVKDPTGQTE